MLTIRREQIDAFKQPLARFQLEVVAHLKGRFRDLLGDWSEQGLLGLVQDGTEKASQYGMITELDVQTFIGLMVFLGANFDVAPATTWAAEILNDSTLLPSEKLAQIDEVQMFREREAR